MARRQGPTPPMLSGLGFIPSSSWCELVSHVVMTTQALAFSFLLAGAAMLLVMSVISFYMTNMTDK